MPTPFPDSTVAAPWDDEIRAAWNEEHDLTTSQHKFAGTPDGTKFLRDNRTWTRLVQTMQAKVFDDVTALTTGDGKFIFMIPSQLNGYDLIAAHAFVTTASSSGLVLVQLRNITNSNVDMLSTRISIDVGEFDSYSAATAPVINTANDNVATGNRISIDVDGAGTGAFGFGVVLSFQ